jgi:NADPH:quinone reductase-like Zn-dependent oxidoreductase
MAEYVVVDATSVSAVPLGLPPAEAAALQMQGINALFCVEDYGHVQKGETVVVHSAAGGVGGLAVQIAVARGARVIGTTSKDEKRKEILELGAEALNYTKGDWVTEVKRLTAGRGAEVMIDGIGGEIFRRSVFEAAAHGGRVIISGVSSGGEVSLTNFQTSAAHRTLVGVSVPSFFPDHVDQVISAMSRLPSSSRTAAGADWSYRTYHKRGRSLPVDGRAQEYREDCCLPVGRVLLSKGTSETCGAVALHVQL